MELEAKGSGPNRSWTPVVPVPEETIAVAMFQWKRVPITRAVIIRMFAYAVIIVLLCTTLAYAASATSPAKYGARTEFKYPVDLGVTSNDFLRSDRVLQSQLVMLKSRSVLAPIALKNHLNPDDLAKQVSASVLDDSEIIRVQVNDHKPAEAQALAAAIFNEYYKQLPDKTLAEQKALQAQVDKLTAQITTAQTELARLGTITSPAATAKADEIAQLIQSRTARQTDLDDAVVKAATNDHVEQITRPYLLDGKVSPKPLQAAIAGLLLGMMLAAGVVALMVRRMLKRLPLDQLD